MHLQTCLAHWGWKVWVTPPEGVKSTWKCCFITAKIKEMLPKSTKCRHTKKACKLILFFRHLRKWSELKILHVDVGSKVDTKTYLLHSWIAADDVMLTDFWRQGQKSMTWEIRCHDFNFEKRAKLIIRMTWSFHLYGSFNFSIEGLLRFYQMPITYVKNYAKVMSFIMFLNT